MKKLLDCFDYLKRYHSDILDVVTIMLELFVFKKEKAECISQMIIKAHKRKPIKEEFQHWVNGPVCPELFNLHKGMFYVDLKTIGKKISGERLSEDEVATVAQVIEEYGGYTAGQLSELTHSEDPWKNTKLNEVITEKAIRQFYGKEKTSAK